MVIRLSSLGDVILSSAVLNPLYTQGFEIDFLTLKPFHQLFESDYRINSVIYADKKELTGASSIKKFASQLKDYDYIIDLHSTFRSVLLTKFLKGKVLRYRKKSILRRLYTKRFFRKFLKKPFNVLEGYIDVIVPLGIEKKIYRPEIILTEKEIDSAKKKLPENFIVIGAGARYRNKSYPFFDKVSQILLKEGFTVVLVGSREDKRIDKGRYSEGVIDLRGKLTIRESLSVVSNALLTVSNDSAVAHMSRAVKTPVLMIYGATHPFFGFYPFPEEGEYILKGLKCQPCHIHGKKECKLKTVECLNIGPEVIANRALNLLKKSL
nr:glycosyltransferase family 9 protein [Persephonella atlantica]